jgi:predicted nuclease of restriction endonuclease-like (RecB) superfamily
MRTFASVWPESSIGQQLVAQLPWGHITHLLDRVSCPTQRDWYARQTTEHGWSRNILVHQIESRLFERQGGALTNFKRTLPAEQSDLAQQIVKDPYSFDFLSLGSEAQERAFEKGLIQQVRSLILELGKGFAFVGNQYHLEVGGQDFYGAIGWRVPRMKDRGRPADRNRPIAIGHERHLAHRHNRIALENRSMQNNHRCIFALVTLKHAHVFHPSRL